MTLSYNIQLGSAANDVLYGAQDTVTSGLNGDDTLYGRSGEDNLVLAGGSGNDTYVAAYGGAITIDDTSGRDTLIAEGMGLTWGSTAALMIEGRHLLAVDVDSLQVVYVLDFRAPGHTLETLQLGDATYSFDDINSVLEDVPNFAGNFSWDELIAMGLPQPGSGAELEAAISTYRAMNERLESAPFYRVSVDGNRADYQVAIEEDQVRLSGAELLSFEGVDRLQFSDGTLVLNDSGSAPSLYRLYEAALDREPDAGGMGYWVDKVDLGMTLHDVAAGFLASPEFASLFGDNPDDATFIEALYANVLDRVPDAGGFQYWSEVLANGTSRADVLIGFSESPENQNNTAAMIQDGIWLV